MNAGMRLCRSSLFALIALALLAGCGLARAQDGAPLRMIVPFGPGTTTDIVSRVEELAVFNKSELAKWAELVKRSGAQVD